MAAKLDLRFWLMGWTSKSASAVITQTVQLRGQRNLSLTLDGRRDLSLSLRGQNSLNVTLKGRTE